MKVYYDLHIHTGLSPCADKDMTPNNIVNMAILNELDVIAITDHNTCGNAAAVMEAASGTPLTVLCGMEVETAEEVHVICLFAALEQGLAFDKAVAATMPQVANKPAIFGTQLYYDADDEVLGTCDRLLMTATALSLPALVDMVKGYGGVAIPAHIDRPSNSVMTNLGFIPPELDVAFIEFSKHTDPLGYFAEHQRLFFKAYGTLVSSDAHYLGDIAEKKHYLTFDTRPDAKAFIRRLSEGAGRDA